MTPLLGDAAHAKIFVDRSDEAAVARADEGMRQTAITQPAVLTVDTALARVLGAYGITPDLVMGHSLGEYGALVAAGAMEFGDALTAVAARGDAMTRLEIDDQGTMAAVFGPLDEVSAHRRAVDGYVVVANMNSTKECVIGGATDAMERAMQTLKAAGLQGRAASGEPRLPHQHRRARSRAAAQGARGATPARAADSGGRERGRVVLPGGLGGPRAHHRDPRHGRSGRPCSS